MSKATPRDVQRKSSEPAKTVDEYLAALPDDVRAALEKLRKTIKAAAPKAAEVISYRIPAYKHHGLLVGFAASKEHCTFHIMSVALTRAHAADLNGYKTGKASIRFEADKPLPPSLISKLTKARIQENEAGRSHGARKK